MPTSQRYKQLRQELARLRRHFLPSKWDPTGQYSDRKIDRARAYRILAHAEIEYFIENICLDVVNREYNAWTASKKPSYVVTCLAIASMAGWEDAETADLEAKYVSPIKIRRDDDSIIQIVERSVKQYRYIVKNNNGIKKRDIKRLIMPLGISLADLDATWLNSMESMAGRRGLLVHTSRVGVTTPPDPLSEKQTVDGLMEGLRQLDQVVAESGT